MTKQLVFTITFGLSTLFSGLCLGQSNSAVDLSQRQIEKTPTRVITIEAKKNVICNGKAVQIITNLTSSDKFSWSPKEVFLNPESRNPWVLTNKKVRISLIVAVDGLEQNKSLTIDVENVKASFEAKPTTGAAPLAVKFNNLSVNANSYYWNFDFDESIEESPEVIYREPGVFSSTLIVEGNKGCKDTMQLKNIKVFEEAKFFIPTTFTPNYDGINETFQLVSRNVAQFKCDIFNSYGEKIYTIRDSRDSWDGTFNGYPAPSASYVYRIAYTDLSGRVHNLVGSMELKR